MNDKLREAWRFHVENGGYIVGRRAVGALEVARAELVLRAAIDEGCARVEWRPDPEEWQGMFEPAGEVLGCVVWVGAELEQGWELRGGEPAGWTDNASLWGIDGVDDASGAPYRRVVEAELALELEDELRRAIGDRRDAATGAGALERETS